MSDVNGGAYLHVDVHVNVHVDVNLYVNVVGAKTATWLGQWRAMKGGAKGTTNRHAPFQFRAGGA